MVAGRSIMRSWDGFVFSYFICCAHNTSRCSRRRHSMRASWESCTVGSSGRYSADEKSEMNA